nr:hypothetical protein [Dictyobacter vulcani]
MLQGKFHPGDLVEASIVDDDLALEVRNRIEQLPPPASATPEAALSAGGEVVVAPIQKPSQPSRGRERSHVPFSFYLVYFIALNKTLPEAVVSQQPFFGRQ